LLHSSEMDLWTRQWGRYHLPQNVFLVLYETVNILISTTSCRWKLSGSVFMSLTFCLSTCMFRYYYTVVCHGGDLLAYVGESGRTAYHRWQWNLPQQSTHAGASGQPHPRRSGKSYGFKPATVCSNGDVKTRTCLCTWVWVLSKDGA